MSYDVRPGGVESDTAGAAARRAPEAVTSPIPKAGRSSPLGPTVYSSGVNFSLYSRDALKVDLLFFDREDDSSPSRTISFYPVVNRTTITGMPLSLACSPVGFTDSGLMDPTIPPAGCGLMLRKSCSTHMVAAWLSRKTTLVKQRSKKETTLPMR